MKEVKEEGMKKGMEEMMEEEMSERTNKGMDEYCGTRNGIGELVCCGRLSFLEIRGKPWSVVSTAQTSCPSTRHII